MKRRDFLKALISGWFLSLFARKVKAESRTGKKQDNNLKVAMFWKRLQ